MSEAGEESETDTNEVLPVGSKFGRYSIVRLIGVGGMGAVYEAMHESLKKRVALKTLHPTFAKNPEIRQRFLREGELASRIHHANVVDVTDFGTENDISFLVMEYLEGMSLEERIEKEGRLESATAADVMLGACAGVAAAHDEGVIHRDLKPANIFLLRQRGGDYRVKIVDFGISKAQEKSLEGNLTSTGHVVGTPYYMAPEQMRSSREVDARADQYSLGVTLYEALCGQKPFEADSLFEVVRKVAQGDYAQPRDLVAEIPEGLEAIVLKMMALEASMRFETLRDVGRALMSFATDRGRALFATEFGDGPAPEVVAPPKPDGTSTRGIRAVSSEKATVLARGAASSGDDVAKATGTGQIFEVSKVPDPPVQRSNKIVGLVGGLAIVAIGVAFWAGQQRDGARASASVPRSVNAQSVGGPTAIAAPAPDYPVSISATPSSAWIVVDDQFTVPGEFTRSFARDGRPHRVTVRAPGYVSQSFEFSGPIVRRVELERDPAAQAPILADNAADAGASSAIANARNPSGRNPSARNGLGGARPSGGNSAQGANGQHRGGVAAGTNGALIMD